MVLKFVNHTQLKSSTINKIFDPNQIFNKNLYSVGCASNQIFNKNEFFQ